MDIESKLDLIKQVGEEIITEEELRYLLKTKEHPIAYDGFEPSGTDIHIAQGILRAINVNRMTKAGIKFKMLVADWHAWANNKLGGNLDNIQAAGKYLIEVWRNCGVGKRLCQGAGILEKGNAGGKKLDNKQNYTDRADNGQERS